jgi:hypothetical protein
MDVKPLHEREREEWKAFSAEVKILFREVSEKAKNLQLVKNQSMGQLLRNHLNHINRNILS